MAKVKAFTKTNIEEVNAAFKSAILKVATQYGLTVPNGTSARYNEESATFKFECFAPAATSGAGEDAKFAPYVVNLKKNSWKYSIEPDQILGKTYKDFEGKTMKVVGMKARAKRNNLIVEDQNTRKLYGTDFEHAAKAIGLKPTPSYF